jgi:integrase/recombinase XerD
MTTKGLSRYLERGDLEYFQVCHIMMPVRLSTTITKINSISNTTNGTLLNEFHIYMRSNGASESHQNNCLKTMIAFAKFIGANTTFHDIKRRAQIIEYLNTKAKTTEDDPDKRWITTWNDYLGDIKYFFRWLYNERIRDKNRDIGEDEEETSTSNWETPFFVNIKKKKATRLSPYSNDQIWDRDELLTIVKYEPRIRNKAALTLFWDLNGRNHEITKLKVGNIRLRERYGEGEIPHNTKTGGGPILLTCSFPYVRDWLNKHPFKNTPESRLICNLYTGGPVQPEAMWIMMKQLRRRIIRVLENGSLTDPALREKLDYLLKTKKWNPYCLRHSSISSDSDYLPEYAVKKKARWSINSRQGARYIKARMGNDLKRTILAQNGIIVDGNDALRGKPAVIICSRCSIVNSLEDKYCSSCAYPLSLAAYEEIKAKENKDYQDLKLQMDSMKFQMQNILSILGSVGQDGKQEIAKMLIGQGVYQKAQ